MSACCCAALLCAIQSHAACMCDSVSAGADISALEASLASLCLQFSECVVSVARKTDASLWPPLFAAVGPASALLEGLLAEGLLHRAACALLVVDCLEGPSTAHSLALHCMQVTLAFSDKLSASPMP